MKIINSQLLSFSMAGLLSFSCGCKDKSPETATSQTKPNIIIILPDDLGWADIGYHGSEIKTPNLDNLARSGIRFTQHYVMPTSTPSRVGLMTGLYPSRYGVLSPDYGEVIDLGDPTLASLLSANGYYTAIAGKWHMGSPPYTPLKYGFKSSYGYFDGQIDPYTHEYKAKTKFTDLKSWHRNDEYLDESGVHATDLITKEAIRIIERDQKEPFFLYVTYSVPHYPLAEPEEWVSLYDGNIMDPTRKIFAASVTHMDDGIGKIINALEKTGKRSNTIVLFVSDNGGQLSWHSQTDYNGKYADKPHKVLGNNFPLRGWKTDLYEGGIRVPAFISWPGQLEPAVMDIPIHITDWLPTFCHLAGCSESMRKDLDGQNVWPYIKGESTLTDTRTMYWKIANMYAVREGNWKMLVNIKTNKVELYDIESDFRELHEISAEHPEIVSHLLELLEEFKKADR